MNDKIELKPCHCYGAMNWVLKYPKDKIPPHSICSCEYKTKCLELTIAKSRRVKNANRSDNA